MNPVAAETDDSAALLERAIAYHRSQQLQEAKAFYEAVLQRRPDQPDALHLLGVIAHQQGRREEALDLIQRAIRANPAAPEYYNSLGAVRQAMGDEAEAVRLYLEAIRIKDDYIAPYNNLIRMRPAAADVRFNLGCVLQRQGKLEEALEQYHAVIRLQPEHATALNNLGCALRELDRTNEALDHLRKAVRLRPDYAEAYNNLGLALQEKGSLKDALACFLTALSLQPDSADTHYNLGRTLQLKGLFEKAMDQYRQAVKLKPDSAKSFYNWGCALDALRQYPEAIAKHAEAIRIDPGYVEAHVNRAILLLLTGDYAGGWKEYEWRLLRKDWRAANQFNSLVPRWDGALLPGGTILVQTEQGFGDTIQFARFLPMVKARCARLVLEAPPELSSLLETIPAVDEIAPREQADHATKADCAVHLMSLAGMFGVTLESVPWTGPYIQAPIQRMAQFQDRISTGGIRVGIAWSGNPAHSENNERSCGLHQFAALSSIPSVRLFSLQKGPAATQLRELPSGMKVMDLGPMLQDFADTAAAVMNLDLIISVDTALVHLAGALGRPIWTLRYHVPYWVWGLQDPQTPWYPTMRIFRQQQPGDWKNLFRRVADELEKFSHQSMQALLPSPEIKGSIHV